MINSYKYAHCKTWHPVEHKRGDFKTQTSIIEIEEVGDKEFATWRCPIAGCKHGLKVDTSLRIAQTAIQRHAKKYHPRRRAQDFETGRTYTYKVIASNRFGLARKIMPSERDPNAVEKIDVRQSKNRPVETSNTECRKFACSNTKRRIFENFER